MYVSTYVHSVCMCVFICKIALSVLVKYTYSVLFCAVEVHSTAVHIPSAPVFSPIPSLDALQATARQLQPCVCEYEATLEGAYTRMQNGEAPTDDIDQEWRRMLRLQETRQREDETRKQVSML